MRTGLLVALSSLAVACGSGADQGQVRFQLVVPGAGIEMNAGESRTIQLMVLGSGNEPATLSGELPAFAYLEGDVLTLAPSRADVGLHTLRLVATAGSARAEATLSVNVSRDNTAPDNIQAPAYWMGDDAGHYWPFLCEPPKCCPGPDCVLGSGPYLALQFCDRDGDAILVDVELVTLGEAFTGTPTYSARSPDTNDTTCAEFEFPLTHVAPGTAYAFSLRVRDEWGATMEFHSEDGWLVWTESFTFRTEP
jgi:hypothetical protein